MRADESAAKAPVSTIDAAASVRPHFSALPPLSLYVHIPWCLSKCPYCDFNSHAAPESLPENAYVDALIAEGHLRPGRVDLVQSGVAVAVRSGAPRPDISSEAALRQAVVAAATLSYSTGPSGTHLEHVFGRWGILPSIRARIVVPPPGTPVGTLVADGRAELGFQQLSELAALPGIDVVGPLPPGVQILTVFSGGVAARCDRPDDARAVLEWMASGDAAEIIRRHWMDPV